MGPPAVQNHSRLKGAKPDSKPKHRPTASVSNVSFSVEELSHERDSSDANSPRSGSSSSTPLSDKKFRRRTRSSLGGTEDLIKELDFLTTSPLKKDPKKPPASPLPSSLDSRLADSGLTEYPALKVQPNEGSEDQIPTSGSESTSGESLGEKTSSTGALEGVARISESASGDGSAVNPRAGASSTNEDLPTHHMAHMSAEQRRKLKKSAQPGVVLPPGGSSDDAASDDEPVSLQNHPDTKRTSTTSTSKPGSPDVSSKATTRNEAVSKPPSGASAKNSPVTSPAKKDSPWGSPARSFGSSTRRDSPLGSPAKKDSPWGSPARKSTPTSSPAKKSSPITSPVKRFLSSPSNRNSPPRPEKQESSRSYMTAKERADEERKVSVRKRVEELERISSGKPNVWKESTSVKAPETAHVQPHESAHLHLESERKKKTDMAAPQKVTDTAGSLGSLSSETMATESETKATESDNKVTGDLVVMADAAPVLDQETKLVSSTESNQADSTSEAKAASVPEEKADISETNSAVVLVSAALTEQVTETKPELDVVSVPSIPAVPDTSDSRENPSVQSQTTPEGIRAVGDVNSSSAEVTKLHENAEVNNVEVTVTGLSEESGIEDAGVERAMKGESDSKNSVMEGANSSQQGPSRAENVLKEGTPLDGASSTVSPDQGVAKRPDDRQVIFLDVNVAELKGSTDKDGGSAVVGLNSVPERSSEKDVAPVDVYAPHEGPEGLKTTSVHKISPAVGDGSSSHENPAESNVSLGKNIEVESVVAHDGNQSSKSLAPNASPDEANSKTESGSKASHDHAAVRDSVSTSVKGTLDNGVLSSQADEGSVLLTKQPAVDPLFVDSQQDRLWEMHSQELTRGEGGTPDQQQIRGSSAQDDETIRYANGGPSDAEASTSGTAANGTGHSEKASKVDRPRTPLRSLLAEDDAADKGSGQEDGAPSARETPIVSPRGNLFRRIVSGGKNSPTKPSTPSKFESKSHSKPFLSSCMCCSPVK